MNILELGVNKDPGQSDSESYDSPNGSKWIVSVDWMGNVSVLKSPNISPLFFDGYSSAEEIGLPFEFTNKPVGVYEWVCLCEEHIDWETGYVDEINFTVIEEKPLWLAH